MRNRARGQMGACKIEGTDRDEQNNMWGWLRADLPCWALRPCNRYVQDRFSALKPDRCVAVKYLALRMKSIFSLHVEHLVNLLKKVCQTVPVMSESQNKLGMSDVERWLMAENNRNLAPGSREIFRLSYGAFPPFRRDELTSRACVRKVLDRYLWIPYTLSCLGDIVRKSAVIWTRPAGDRPNHTRVSAKKCLKTSRKIWSTVPALVSALFGPRLVGKKLPQPTDTHTRTRLHLSDSPAFFISESLHPNPRCARHLLAGWINQCFFPTAVPWLTEARLNCSWKPAFSVLISRTRC